MASSRGLQVGQRVVVLVHCDSTRTEVLKHALRVVAQQEPGGHWSVRPAPATDATERAVHGTTLFLKTESRLFTNGHQEIRPLLLALGKLR